MTIYIDVIILENLIMNYIIIYATTIVLKKKAQTFRIFISSLIRSILCNNIIYISNTNPAKPFVLCARIANTFFPYLRLNFIGKSLILGNKFTHLIFALSQSLTVIGQPRAAFVYYAKTYTKLDYLAFL